MHPSGGDTALATLKAFARGAAFAASGYDSCAIELTHIDGPAEDIQIAFGFEGGLPSGNSNPAFIFALCSNSTLECTCHDWSGDLDMDTLECLTSVDMKDACFVD